MKRSILRVLTTTAALAGVACSDSVTDPSQSASLLDAFVPALAGFSNAQSSFSDGIDGGMIGGPLGGPSHGRHRGGDGLGLMGGGLGGAFLGAGFGARFGHRPYDDGGIITQCVYSAASGRISCDPITRNGLTITRSVAYTDASGAAQSAYDESTTNTINTQLAVSGTVVGRFRRPRGHHHFGDGSPLGVSVTGEVINDTTTVEYASNRTVGGLADASTERTVSGTSAGQEATVATDSIGRFTLTRVAGDTVTGVVIPITTDSRPYPTAGTVIRSMKVTLTYDGQSPVSSTRREVVTYDGSTTATVVITQDGETQTCSLPLPRGRISCS
jgi:hypothetical protein